MWSGHARPRKAATASQSPHSQFDLQNRQSLPSTSWQVLHHTAQRQRIISAAKLVGPTGAPADTPNPTKPLQRRRALVRAGPGARRRLWWKDGDHPISDNIGTASVKTSPNSNEVRPMAAKIGRDDRHNSGRWGEALNCGRETVNSVTSVIETGAPPSVEKRKLQKSEATKSCRFSRARL